MPMETDCKGKMSVKWASSVLGIKVYYYKKNVLCHKWGRINYCGANVNGNKSEVEHVNVSVHSRSGQEGQVGQSGDAH